MKPLLAHVYEPHRVTYPCYVQPKLNGIRALYQGGHFQSRDEIPFPVGLLDHLAKPLLGIFGERHHPLDGELYVHGWSLQRINAAVTPVRQKPTEDTKLVEYHVFDSVDFTKSFADRSPYFWEKFDCEGPGCVRIVSTRKVESQQKADACYARWIDLGYEGMMYRLGDCPYTTPKQHGVDWFKESKFVQENSRTKFLSDKDNRAWHLLKRKSWMDEEFECLGVEEGEGKYQGMVGAFRCGTNDPGLSNTFTVSGGLSDIQRDKYWDHPELVIGKKIKVKFLCYSEDGIPLNPTILLIP